MHPLIGQSIVFLPGIDGTEISFEPLRELLPRDADVKVIRYPVDKILDFDETVKCVADQVQSVHQDAIVIAQSFSGPVAVALVGSGKLKAKCLILCSTFAKSPRPALLKILGFLPLELILSLPFPKFFLKHVIGGEDEATDLFLAMWQRVKPLVPARTLVHRLKVVSRVDVRDWLPKLTIPCLYIQATFDRSVPASSLFDFTENVADLRVKRIKGPHFILQARPEESLSAILNFMDLMTHA
jgi:pimeloyl-[acyl-carrier protein] methyl ester esterase